MARKTISFHPAIPADVNRPLTLNMGEPFVPQVEKFFAEGPDLREVAVTGFFGQAVAAVLGLPVLEMSRGLPADFALFGFGAEIKQLGSLDLGGYRHNAVRPRRSEVPDGEEFSGYTVLDGAGRKDPATGVGMTAAQLSELAQILDCKVGDIRVLDVSVGHVDCAAPEKGDPKREEDLAGTLIKSGLTKADWVSGRLIFLPPGLGPLAAVMATAIYGLSEVWPKTIRLVGRPDRSFAVAEVVDPQPLRQFGIHLAAKWAAGQAPVSVPRELFGRLLWALDGYEETIQQTGGLPPLDPRCVEDKYLPCLGKLLAELRALDEKK